MVFAVDLFLPEGKKGYLALLSIAGLIAIIVLSLVMLWDEQESLYDGLLAVDDFALFFKVFFLGMGIFIILSSMDFVENRLKHQGEFYGLLLFSILGMNIMAQSRELLTAYIALELLSFSLYVLAAYAGVELYERFRAWKGGAGSLVSILVPSLVFVAFFGYVNVPVRARVDNWSYRLADTFGLPTWPETSRSWRSGSRVAGTTRAR